MESVKISGAGTIVGGEYDEVLSSGSATIKGAIKCNKFKTSGAVKCDSLVEAKEFKTSGSAKLEGDLKVIEGRASGAIRITGSVEATKFRVSGSAIVEGDVNVDEFIARIGNGSFENIYGDNIQINSDGSFAPNYVYDVVKNITVKNIEATNISIKDVTAERVSGETVCVEEGCNIKTIEYSKTLDISSKAKVERIIKL